MTTPFWKRDLEALDWACTSRVLWAFRPPHHRRTAGGARKSWLDNLNRRCRVARRTSSHAHHGLAQDVAQDVKNLAQDGLDAVILDMADLHAIDRGPRSTVARRRASGVLLPVTSQLERAWEACEAAGLAVDWAGEIMERPWSRASRGGVRPRTARSDTRLSCSSPNDALLRARHGCLTGKLGR